MEYKDMVDMTFAKNVEERLKIQKKYPFNDYTKMNAEWTPIEDKS
jgi:hypothetical protein